ncbi:MAG TPA: Crp/Fnr family transcriptional regulator [Allosphingosinicella sp.]|nr:Crp/Fnr family transcriptional regulator [Allosphingosinicella sp.]HYG28767.1 Crp/Fnr family transcriptional regulator [Allosphingosinicella sp.]
MRHFAERIGSRVTLTEMETAFLSTLEARTVSYARHQSVVRAGDPAEGAFVLQSGWVMSYSQFPTGARQVRRLHFPGDLVAMPSVLLERHAEDVETLCDATLAPFDKRLLGGLFRHPRLAAIMFMFAQLERITSGDRLCSVARLPAKARMAFLLIDILDRLRSVDARTGSSVHMHLTREQMGDFTGMTPVHASRMWSELLAERAIRCDGAVVTILDEPRLRRLSGYRSLDLDFRWLESVDAGPSRPHDGLAWRS